MKVTINEIFFRCPYCKKRTSMLINGIPDPKSYDHVCKECSHKIQIACNVSNKEILSVEVK